MSVRLLLFLMLAVTPVAATGVHAATTAQPEPAAWRRELQTLVRELPKRHPAPFLHVTQARWDSAATSLDKRLASASRNQMMVGFMQLVTLLGDAHTVVQPDSALGLRYYPFELYSFDDGLFVRRADKAHASLVGSKVLRIGRATAAEAMERVATVVPHENEWWVRAWAPLQLMIPELLDGLGIATDIEKLTLVVERDGKVDSVRVAPAGHLLDAHGHGPVPVDMSTWASMRTGPAPWWEQRPGEFLWWMHDPTSRTLYVCQRGVVPLPNSNTNRPQWDQVFALADSLKPARLVLDLRENTGGNGGLNRYPVQQILRRPALDRPDKLYVIIGRLTFSAAQQFANLLEAWTQATFVGEPTGQRPTQYGDHRPLPLPGVGLTIQISTVFHQAPNEFDTREFIPPRVYTPLDSRSYRSGTDPAMAAILSPENAAAVFDAIERALASGDSATAERALTAAREKPANRFRSFERDVNALGYRLLGAQRTEQALVVFRMNTRAFPHSANTFDSLAEAQLAAGYRDAAIASYRRAIKVEPSFPPSVQALERLGAH
jgi:hypothetical protein